jgi:hypothetical protein
MTDAIEHTQEPWFANTKHHRIAAPLFLEDQQKQIWIESASGALIACVNNWNDADKEAAANGTLIAEAPTLKRQLAECRAELEVTMRICERAQAERATLRKHCQYAAYAECREERDGWKRVVEKTAAVLAHPLSADEIGPALRNIETFCKAALSPTPETSDGAGVTNEDRFLELLGHYNAYSIDDRLGISVARRPSRPWIVYRQAEAICDDSYPPEPVKHLTLEGAIAAAVRLVEAVKTSDGAGGEGKA